MLDSGEPFFQPMNQVGGMGSWVNQELGEHYGLPAGHRASVVGLLRAQTAVGSDLIWNEPYQ
eukprot:12850312-Prorocentrum_lima.AAC.1